MSTPANRLVTVIIPSFNQGRFIRETIDSCLAQDYRPLEILVMDGGSSDDTVAVLESYAAPELHWWTEPDGGVVDAVNKGMQRARGDILTIQSTDDVFLPGALTAAVQALQAAPAAGLVYGDIELMNEHSEMVGADEQGEFDYAAYLGRFQYIPQPGTCFTRAAMEAVGGWRDSVSYAADADLWMRIAAHFPVTKLVRRVGRYRYHDAQRDTQRARIARDWAIAVNDLIASGVLSPVQRRHARMGIHLARYRYADVRAWAQRTRALYAALFANPAAFFDRRFPKRELIPAYSPVLAMLSRAKRKLGLGALAKDMPRYMLALRQRGDEYLCLCNRGERLERSPDGQGFKCDWQWTSNLFAPQQMPLLGRALMRRALADHRVLSTRQPETNSREPDVTFIIGHRGLARLPLLQATLGTIAAQRHASIECIVVEQDTEAHAGPLLPKWVRHIHSPLSDASMPFCRSWAFNVGARAAKGKILVLHDNDMLVPGDYAAEAVKRVGQGYACVNLKRFVFYLSRAHTEAVLSHSSSLTAWSPLAVVQNLQGGGSIVIDALAFESIGGMDESFVGWGGEDNEFWERAQSLRVWHWGYLPLVHLWHDAQPGKQAARNPTLSRYRTLSRIDPAVRIAALRQLPRGAMSGPAAQLVDEQHSAEAASAVSVS
jgi:glycosyltransferase involved in cell wall biosynthesis